MQICFAFDHHTITFDGNIIVDPTRIFTRSLLGLELLHLRESRSEIHLAHLFVVASCLSL